MTSVDPFYQRRPMAQILREGTVLYGQNLWHLTRPLILPVGAILIGMILWLGLPNLMLDWLMPAKGAPAPTWAIWTGFIASNIPGAVLFFKGFWRYLVWVSALNLMVRDLLDHQPLNPLAYRLRITHRSVDYSLVWTFLFAVVFLPLAVSVILPATIASLASMNMTTLLLMSIASIGVGVLVGLALMLSFTLTFQVFAFNPGPAGACLVRSAQLVARNPIKTLLIAILMVVTTQAVLPSLIVSLCDILRITQGLSFGGAYAVRYLLEHCQEGIALLGEPAITRFYQGLLPQTKALSTMLIQTLILSVSTALLLPLGTIWFALLYGDLKYLSSPNSYETRTSTATPQHSAV